MYKNVSCENTQLFETFGRVVAVGKSMGIASGHSVFTWVPMFVYVFLKEKRTQDQYHLNLLVVARIRNKKSNHRKTLRQFMLFLLAGEDVHELRAEQIFVKGERTCCYHQVPGTLNDRRKFLWKGRRTRKEMATKDKPSTWPKEWCTDMLSIFIHQEKKRKYSSSDIILTSCCK